MISNKICYHYKLNRLFIQFFVSVLHAWSIDTQRKSTGSRRKSFVQYYGRCNLFSYCSSLSPLFNVDIFCPYARIDISCLTLNIALKIFICFMNLYQHYLELEFGSQWSMRKCSKRERERMVIKHWFNVVTQSSVHVHFDMAELKKINSNWYIEITSKTNIWYRLY